jgi:hypothetical protein
MPSGGKRNRSGPPKKPRELKIIEGSFRKDRDGNTPPVVGAFPPIPGDVSEAEAALWQTFPKPGWIGETDGLAVRAAVSIFARILAVQQAMRATPDAANPLTFKVSFSADGEERLEPKPNPLYTLELQLWGRLMAVLGALGLTPADRGKVSVPKVDEASVDKWAGIL